MAYKDALFISITGEILSLAVVKTHLRLNVFVVEFASEAIDLGLPKITF